MQPCAPCHGPFSESLSTIGQPGRIVVCPCARSQCKIPSAGCRNPAGRSSRARDGRMPGVCRPRGRPRPGRRRPGRGRSGPARAQHLLHSVTCRGSPRIEARLLCELDIVQDAAQRGIIPKFARLLHLGAAVSNSEPNQTTPCAVHGISGILTGCVLGRRHSCDGSDVRTIVGTYVSPSQGTRHAFG